MVGHGWCSMVDSWGNMVDSWGSWSNWGSMVVDSWGNMVDSWGSMVGKWGSISHWGNLANRVNLTILVIILRVSLQPDINWSTLGSNHWANSWVDWAGGSWGSHGTSQHWEDSNKSLHVED